MYLVITFESFNFVVLNLSQCLNILLSHLTDSIRYCTDSKDVISTAKIKFTYNLFASLLLEFIHTNKTV